MCDNTNSPYLKNHLGNVSSGFLFLSQYKYLLWSVFIKFLITKISSLLKKDWFAWCFCIIYQERLYLSTFRLKLKEGLQFLKDPLISAYFICQILGMLLFYKLNVSVLSYPMEIVKLSVFPILQTSRFDLLGYQTGPMFFKLFLAFSISLLGCNGLRFLFCKALILKNNFLKFTNHLLNFKCFTSSRIHVEHIYVILFI